jgi:hypothetical protein
MLRRLKAMSLLSISVSSVLALLLVSSHFSMRMDRFALGKEGEKKG